MSVQLCGSTENSVASDTEQVGDKITRAAEKQRKIESE
jgi:hypothetical protein